MGHSCNMSSRKITWFKSWEVFEKIKLEIFVLCKNAEIDVISYEFNNK